MSINTKSIFEKYNEMSKEQKETKTRAYREKVQRVMNKGISDAKKEARLFNANKSYEDALNKYYKDNRIGSISIFDSPLKFFRLIEKGIYFHNNPKVNYMTDLVNGFAILRLPHTYDYKAEFDLINALYDLLKVTPKEGINYWSVLDDYKFKYQPLKGLELMSSPKSHFLLYDNNIWYTNYGIYQIDKEFPALILVSTHTIKYIFACYSLPLPNRITIKQIFKYMKKESSTLLNLYNNNYPVIVYKYLNCYYHTEYTDIDTNYRLSNFIPTPYIIHKHTTITKKLNSSMIPKYMAGTLFYLTNGDIRVLNSIAILIADILLENNISKKIHVIIASPINLSKIENFIQTIIGNQTMIIENLSSMTSKKMLYKIISGNANYSKAIIITKPAKIPVSSKCKLLRRIITGKEIAFQDDVVGKIYFNNKLPIISLVSQHESILRYTNNFPTNIINLCHIENMDELLFDDEDLNWLRVPFALYGINLLESRNTFAPIKVDKSLLQDTISKEFLDLFCSIKNNSEVFATDLYNAYTDYFQAQYNDLPLTRIQFIKSIKKLLESVKGSNFIRYYRPHHSRANNSYAFQGLDLDTSKLNAFLISKINKQLSSDFKEFYEYLLQLNKLIPDEFLQQDSENKS